MEMLIHKKLKILLVQLPFPSYKIDKDWGNIPLASGYLKSMAYKEGLLNEVEIEILDKQSTNLSSDSRLIDLIILKSPDVLGLSLYNWNSFRSLFIAKAVKRKLPFMKIVVGGPEVTLDTEYILDDPVVDIGCLGEGEFTFMQIIRSIINGQDDYANIKGLFYRQYGKIIVTPPREPTKDLDVIPSPYILGFINPKDYGEAWLENMRGCQFKCTYCAHATRPLGYFSAERIHDELKVILKSGVSLVRFINGTFISAPNFYKICKTITEINSHNRLSFGAFGYAEHINREKADLLKEANFVGLEIGLQSVNSATLGILNRESNLKNFITGVNLLKERDIDFVIDVIIGLPNETLSDFKRTLGFLRNNGYNDIHSYLLFILPGTPLRKEAERYGIKYQNKPPYFITETPHFSKSEIRTVITLVGGKSRPSLPESLVNYCNVEYPLSHEKGANNSVNKNVNYLHDQITKVILELDASYQSAGQLEQASKRLSGLILQPFTLWLKTRNLDRDFGLMKSFILPIASSNPFLLWSIILETDNEFPTPMIGQIRRNIASKETFDAIKICIVTSWANGAKNQSWLKNMSKLVPFVYSFDISEESDWRGEIGNLCRTKYGRGILVDFNPELGLEFVVNVSKSLHKIAKDQGKNIFFRNLAINYLGKLEHDTTKDISIIKPTAKHIESILQFDKNLDIVSLPKSPKQIVADLVECQIKFMRILKRTTANKFNENVQGPL